MKLVEALPFSVSQSTTKSLGPKMMSRGNYLAFLSDHAILRYLITRDLSLSLSLQRLTIAFVVAAYSSRDVRNYLRICPTFAH